jgi:hypothetical protein
MLSVVLLGCGGGGSNNDQLNPNPNTAVSDGGDEGANTDYPVKNGKADSDNGEDTDSTVTDGDNQPADDSSEENLVGFYMIEQTEQLCLSYNLGINNVADSSSTDID